MQGKAAPTRDDDSCGHELGMVCFVDLAADERATSTGGHGRHNNPSSLFTANSCRVNVGGAHGHKLDAKVVFSQPGIESNVVNATPIQVTSCQ